MKLGTGQAFCDIIRITSIRAVGVERRGEGRAEGKPEAPEGAKDDERECIAEEELEDAAQAHEKAANEIISAHRGDAVSA